MAFLRRKKKEPIVKKTVRKSSLQLWKEMAATVQSYIIAGRDKVKIKNTRDYFENFKEEISGTEFMTSRRVDVWMRLLKRFANLRFKPTHKDMNNAWRQARRLWLRSNIPKEIKNKVKTLAANCQLLMKDLAEMVVICGETIEEDEIVMKLKITTEKQVDEYLDGINEIDKKFTSCLNQVTELKEDLEALS
ncbi:MAG: hypothetical protein KAT77_03265 [Nanoarchaeota archaeon]|nr:hypothetical protein [Nanoarchaeota archaeon]